MVETPGIEPELRAAFDKAQADFFGKMTQDLEGIVRSLAAGEIPQRPFAEWQSQSAGLITTVASVAGVAADLITSRAQDTAARSEHIVILYSVMLAVAAVRGACGY